MNNPVSLNVANFFETYITDPSSKDLKPKDQAIAWVATIVLGVLTLGIAQLASYALRGRVSKDHVSNDAEKKTTNVGKEVLSPAPSGTTPSTQNNDLETFFPELKNPKVKESLDQLLKNDKLKTLSDGYLKFLSKFPDNDIKYTDSDWNRWIAEEEKLGGSIIKTLYGDLTKAKAESEEKLEKNKYEREQQNIAFARETTSSYEKYSRSASDESKKTIKELNASIESLEKRIKELKDDLEKPFLVSCRYIANKYQFMFDGLAPKDKPKLNFAVSGKGYPTTPFISLDLYLAARKKS